MNAKNGGASQLEDFIRLANEAKIHTEETGGGSHEENWQVIVAENAKKPTEDAQDKEEWVFVGKTEAEKKLHTEARKKLEKKRH